MSPFRLAGLDPAPFEPLFLLDDAELDARGIVRRFADAHRGFPCRVGLEDARVGEELLLLNHEHLSARSPYRASGPVYVRRGARRRVLPPGQVPPYVASRLISVRAYDRVHRMVDAQVCEGRVVAAWLETAFARADIAYAHLHNARHDYYSCLAERTWTPAVRKA